MEMKCTKRRGRLSSVAAIVLSVVATLSTSTARAEPPASATAPVPTRSNVPAYVGFGLAGASIVVGTVFGVLAITAKNDYTAHPTADAADRAQIGGLVADIAFGVAFASGFTALVYLLSNPSPPRPVEPARVHAFFTPIVSPTMGGVGAAVTF